jgi:hypothetical protein
MQSETARIGLSRFLLPLRSMETFRHSASIGCPPPVDHEIIFGNDLPNSNCFMPFYGKPLHIIFCFQKII